LGRVFNLILATSLSLTAAAAMTARNNLVFVHTEDPIAPIIEENQKEQKQYLQLYALNNAPIFTSPTLTSSTIGNLSIGDSVFVYNEVFGSNYTRYFVSDQGYIRHTDLTYLEEYVFYPISKTFYAASGASVIDLPGDEGQIVYNFNLNDTVKVKGYNNFGYYQVEDYGYIKEDDLMTSPYIIMSYSSGNSTLTPSSGIYFYNGRKETYYSSRVLYHYKTPQWYLDGEGFYHDSNGYYVVAASDMAQGTVFDCSKGSCIVLDSGCAAGVTDYYVNW
jgi:hypothetical protein